MDVLARSESVTILSSRVRALSAADADITADAAGDLALAVAQAAGYMAETRMPASCWARYRMAPTTSGSKTRAARRSIQTCWRGFRT